MKQASKQRTNWLRQERNSKGHFMPYKKEKEQQCQCSMAIKVLGDGCDICNPSLALKHAREYIKDLEDEARELEEKSSCSECGRKSEDGWALYCVDCLESFRVSDMEHAFYSGLKANNSFYPPSKLWEFYKRDRVI